MKNSLMCIIDVLMTTLFLLPTALTGLLSKRRRRKALWSERGKNRSPWKSHQPAAAVKATLYPSRRGQKSHTFRNNPFLRSSRKLSCQQEASQSGSFFLEKNTHAASCLSAYSKGFKQIIANNQCGARCSTKRNPRAEGGLLLCLSILMSTATKQADFCKPPCCWPCITWQVSISVITNESRPKTQRVL